MASSNDSATSIGGMDDTIPVDATAGGRFRGGAEIRKVKNLLVTDFPAITGPVTATHTELNVLDGIPGTLTATELGYVDGVTDAIQTQMDTKSPTASPTFTGTVTTPLTASRVATINASQELDVSAVTLAELNVLDGVTAFLDEDDMASDSATSLVSQQSIKAYIDAQVAGSGMKSIQTGYEAIDTGDWSISTGEDYRYNEITITAVVQANSVVLIQGGSVNTTTDVTTLLPTGHLTSTTNLRIAAQTEPSIKMHIRWTVVEYN